MADDQKQGIGSADLDALNKVIQTSTGVDSSADALSAALKGTAPTTDKPKRQKAAFTDDQKHNAKVLASVQNKLVSRSDDEAGKPLGQLRLAMSKYARFCGFLNMNAPKIDFSLQKVTKKKEDKTASDAVEYRLRLTNTAPSAPTTYIFRVPTDIKALIAQGNVVDMEMINKVIENPSSWAIELVPASQIDTFFQKNTAGYIYEDEAIFCPTVRKSGKGEAVAVNSYNSAPKNFQFGIEEPHPALYRNLSVTKDQDVKITIKSSVRSRLVSPTNYISKNEFETIKLQKSMSAADAAAMTKLYLGKYLDTKNDATTVCKLTLLTREQQPHFAVKSAGTGYEFTGNDLFTIDASKSIVDTFTCQDWYEKDMAGNAKIHKATDIAVAKKIMEDDAKAPKYLKKELMPADTADKSAYKFNPQHAVIRATRNLLEYDRIKSEMARKTESKATPRSQSLKVAGRLLMGMTLEDFQSSLKEARSSI